MVLGGDQTAELSTRLEISRRQKGENHIGNATATRWTDAAPPPPESRPAPPHGAGHVELVGAQVPALWRWCADSARWASSGRHVDHRDRRRVMLSGYHQHARVENAFFRYTSIVGDCLRARSSSGQRREAVLACHVLNRMTELGRPVSYRIGR